MPPVRPDFEVLLDAAWGVEPPNQVHTHPTRVARDLGHFVCCLGAPAAPPRGVGMQVALATGGRGKRAAPFTCRQAVARAFPGADRR